MRSASRILLALAIGLAGPAIAGEPKALCETSSVACHDPTAKSAIPGTQDLATRLGKSDAELAASILNGFQTPGSPMAMPANRGIAALTAADAESPVAYLRSLGKS